MKINKKKNSYKKNNYEIDKHSYFWIVKGP